MADEDTLVGDHTLRLASLLPELLRQGGVLESTAGGEVIDLASVKAAVRARIKQTARLTTRVESEDAPRAGPDAPHGAAAASDRATAELRGDAAEADVDATAADIVDGGLRAAARIRAGEAPSTLTTFERSSLEAIVEVVGRPAMRFVEGRVQMPTSDLGANGRWRVIVAVEASRVNRVAASVGRIALGQPPARGGTLGTGWRLGDDLLVTNRHVAWHTVADPGAPRPAWCLDPAKPAFVDFATVERPAARRTAVLTQLVYCDEEDAIDLAVFRVTAAEGRLPAGLPITWSAESDAGPLQGQEVYVIGHPERQSTSDPIRHVFGVVDGSKRWSPGLIKRAQQASRVFEHDCSTLGGNSGSCVVGVRDHHVIGLHFGGAGVDASSGRGDTNLALWLAGIANSAAGTALKATES